MPPKKVARKVTQSGKGDGILMKDAKRSKKMNKPAVEVMETDESLNDNQIEDTAHSSTETNSGEVVDAIVFNRHRGRKRKSVAIGGDSLSESVRSISSSVSIGSKRFHLSVSQFLPSENGSRVLSCGEGEQIGHPGRTTTKKPRKIDTLPNNESVVQVVAGGVHSLVLLDNGSVYTCGINEKGTTPGEGVESEGSVDQFTIIKFDNDISLHGKIVMLAAGASFSAALTEKGSVIAWGNLRSASGCIESHKILLEMEKRPIVIVQHSHRVIVKIAAGENHLVMLSEYGELLTFGDGSMGQLGRSSRVAHIRSQHMVDNSGDSLKVSVKQKGRHKLVFFNNIMAGGFWSAARSTDGHMYVCGLNNYGQLGIKVPESNSSDIGAENEPELRIMRPIEVFAFDSIKITQLCGIQHIIALDESGVVYGIGKNTDNALGLGTWTGKDDTENWKYSELQIIDIPEKVAGVSASLGCSIVWTLSGKAYSWGYDTSGQLGLGIKADDDEKLVPRPQLISSAHLDGYKVIGASIADNHALFLAREV